MTACILACSGPVNDDYRHGIQYLETVAMNNTTKVFPPITSDQLRYIGWIEVSVDF